MSKALELAIAIKGKIDGSLASSFTKAQQEALNLKSEIANLSTQMNMAKRTAKTEEAAYGAVSTATQKKLLSLNEQINTKVAKRADLLKQTAKAEDSSAKMSKMAGALAPAALAITGAMALGIKSFAEFDERITAAGVKADATSEEIKQMGDAAMSMSMQYAISAGDVAASMDRIAAAGYSANETMALTPIVMKAAIAMGENAAITADTLTATLSIFDLKQGDIGKNAMHVSDVITTSANISNVAIQDVQQSMQYVGPVAKSLGVSLEEVASDLSILRNAGIDASTIGTSLRSMLSRLVGTTGEAASTLQQLGVKTQDAQGQFLGLGPVIEQLQKSMQGMGNAQQAAALKTIFGEEALSSSIQLMKVSPAEIEKITSAINNSGGATEEAYNKMRNSTGFTLRQMVVDVQTTITALSGSQGNLLKSFASSVSSVLGSFTAASQAHPAVASLAISIGALVVGLTGFLFVAAGAIHFIAFLGESWELASKGVKVFNAAMEAGKLSALTNPYVLAIMAIIAIIYLLYTNWDTVTAAIGAVWSAVCSTISSVWSGVVSALSAGWAAVTSAGSAFLDFFINLPGTIAFSIGFIIGYISTLPEAIGEFIVAAIAWLINLPTAMYEVGAAFIASASEWCAEAYVTVVSWISNLVISAIAFLINLPSDCAAAGAAFVAAAESWAINAYNAVINWIEQVPGRVSAIISSAWNTIKAKFSAGITVGINAGQSAQGGIFNSPYLTWVAEAGYPEAIVPLQRNARSLSLWAQAGQALGVQAPEAATTPMAIAVPTNNTNSSNLTFSPNVTVNGGDESTIQRVAAMLDEQRNKFADMYQKMMAEDRRLAVD